MKDKVTVVMYHYVRDFRNNRYPNIKGLDTELFEQQIEFFKKNYNIISMEELIEWSANGKGLPNNSLLLTFDDGYIDHYITVFPILNKNNIQGSFFVPAKTVKEGKILDVNKIHFILATLNASELTPMIFKLLDLYREDGNNNLLSNDDLYKKLAISNRFDDADTIFVKRLLQVELDESLRSKITNKLFEDVVGIPESVLARELYLSYEQIEIMKRYGMYFGIHGYDHYWLGEIKLNDAKNDIYSALEFFENIIDKNNWTICYPYGSYNEHLLNFIDKIGCKFGFTTEVAIFDADKYDLLTIPRLDTNDFPPKSNKYLSIS